MYTIVSAVPFAIRETKAGQIPPEYNIPAADKDIQVVYVEDASCGVYIDSDRGTFKQVITSDEVARGLIEDFSTAQLEYLPDAKPALFALPGKLTVEEVKQKYSDKLTLARTYQTAWFWRLVRRADDDWKKFGQHRVITDSQRLAAKALGLENRDWVPTADELQTCPACSSMVKPNVALCPKCHCILDEKKAANLKFAKVG